MLGYVIRRLLQAIPAILGVTIVVFLLLHASGDPAQVALQQGATEEELETYREAWGLNKPLYIQYVTFLFNAIKGNFGVSQAYGKAASEIVFNRLPATIYLAITAACLSLLVGVSAGIIAALKRNSIFDNLTMFGAVLGQSVAQFWLGLMLILFFAVKLPFLPTSGMGSGIQSVKHLILPALTLSPWLMALSARLVRSGMLEVMRQDYIRTAYAKGLTYRLILTRHALRNALIPLLTMTGLSFAYMMGGSIIVETIFAWPGIGLLAYTSIIRRDYNVVLCIVTMVATGFVIINVLVDIVIGYIDPRVRREGINIK